MQATVFPESAPRTGKFNTVNIDFDSSDERHFPYQGGEGAGFAFTKRLSIGHRLPLLRDSAPLFGATDGQTVDFGYATHKAIRGLPAGGLIWEMELDGVFSSSVVTEAGFYEKSG